VKDEQDFDNFIRRERFEDCNDRDLQEMIIERLDAIGYLLTMFYVGVNP